MSYLSELSSSGFDQRNTEELLSRGEPVEKEPGFFEGSIKGPAMGIMRGGAKAADFLMTFFGKSPAMSDEQERINELADQLQDEQVKSAVDMWTPNPRTVGTAGRVLGGLGEMVLPLAAGGGDPALLIGTNTLAAGKRAIDEGVDSTTAGGIAVIEGAATYAGLKLPVLGNNLTQRLVTGAAGNLVLGAGSTEAEHLLLDSRGYEELAKNYDPLDGEARAVDLLSGLVFGGLHHLTVPSERNAVATVNNAKHFQKDTAPGVPADPVASAVHQGAMADATEQLLAGEPVNVREDVTRATFKPRPDAGNPVPEELRQLDRAQAELSDKSAAQEESAGYDVAEGELTDEQLAAFQGLRSDVQADQDSGGARGRAPADEGSSNAGRPGAGAGKPLEVFRGTDRPLTAEHFGEEALGRASGNPSSGLGVFFTNDHADASRYGPIVERAHLDIRNPKVIKIEDFPAFDTLEQAAAFRKQLQAEGHDGIVIDISHLGGPTQYVAFDHAQVVKLGAAAKPKVAPKTSAKAAEPGARQEPEAAADDPITASVRESLAADDVKLPTGEIDADGNAVTRSARELMAEADAEVAAAQDTGQGIAAAVSCFLTRGT